MVRRVEDAIRATVSAGDLLATPSGRGHFRVERYTPDGMILLLGEKEWPTLLPWRALEDLPDFLIGRGWVLIGSTYSSESEPGSLDEYMKSSSNGRPLDGSLWCWKRPP